MFLQSVPPRLMGTRVSDTRNEESIIIDAFFVMMASLLLFEYLCVKQLVD